MTGNSNYSYSVTSELTLTRHTHSFQRSGDGPYTPVSDYFRRRPFLHVLIHLFKANNEGYTRDVQTCELDVSMTRIVLC